MDQRQIQQNHARTTQEPRKNSARHAKVALCLHQNVLAAVFSATKRRRTSGSVPGNARDSWALGTDTDTDTDTDTHLEGM